MNEDIREEVPMQCNTNPQKDYGLVEHTNHALGGAKRPHESSDSDKEQPTVGSPLNNNDGRQLSVIGQSTGGWI